MEQPIKILVTGVSGFIGMHMASILMKEGHTVTGIDNINSYYDTGLKYARLNTLGIHKNDILYNKEIKGNSNFTFVELDLNDAGNLIALFARKKFDMVINLAAQAGVRYSITNPKDYIDSNILGFFNLLEACRTFPVKHLIYASSSSVYGNNPETPFKTEHNTDQPVSLYAATKKTNELMAHTYAHLHHIPCTGLRFFTVYGPWGRPDMAYFTFTNSIMNGTPISLYNNGNLERDFTFIDDITESIRRLVMLPPPTQPLTPYHTIMNIGNQVPVKLTEFVNTLEEIIGKKALIDYKPMQPGDVLTTFSDSTAIEQLTGFSPKTNLKDGLTKFVEWYKSYYK